MARAGLRRQPANCVSMPKLVQWTILLLLHAFMAQGIIAQDDKHLEGDVAAIKSTLDVVQLGNLSFARQLKDHGTMFGRRNPSQSPFCFPPVGKPDCGSPKDTLEVYDLGNGQCLTRGIIKGIIRIESACDYLPFGRSRCLDINANILIGFRKAQKNKDYVQPDMQAHLDRLGIGSAKTVRGLLTISAFKPYEDDFPEINPVFFTNLTRVGRVIVNEPGVSMSPPVLASLPGLANLRSISQLDPVYYDPSLSISSTLMTSLVSFSGLECPVRLDILRTPVTTFHGLENLRPGGVFMAYENEVSTPAGVWPLRGLAGCVDGAMTSSNTEGWVYITLQNGCNLATWDAVCSYATDGSGCTEGSVETT